MKSPITFSYLFLISFYFLLLISFSVPQFASGGEVVNAKSASNPSNNKNPPKSKATDKEELNQEKVEKGKKVEKVEKAKDNDKKKDATAAAPVSSSPTITDSIYIHGNDKPVEKNLHVNSNPASINKQEYTDPFLSPSPQGSTSSSASSSTTDPLPLSDPSELAASSSSNANLKTLTNNNSSNNSPSEIDTVQQRESPLTKSNELLSPPSDTSSPDNLIHIESLPENNPTNTTTTSEVQNTTNTSPFMEITFHFMEILWWFIKLHIINFVPITYGWILCSYLNDFTKPKVSYRYPAPLHVVNEPDPDDI